ncbi:vWA domain-containing protein [Aeoliella mucimassa]|uniref:von Willebrand factor type A domain protein n=1 Tax=Aeoliella mucimassa TaxID=2527972 RepID=A0A518AUG6_9BACT|nr:vWA domain-containing protein [Aeoliella mucimassa]QDU58367.1 von Willebrand factor type A domain protein [Aeoliella mucimassa]
MAALALFSICWIGGAVLLNPPRTVAIVALGSSYEQNLAIPPNAFGWNTLEDLCQSNEVDNQQFFYGRHLHRLPDAPLRVTRQFDWQRALTPTEGHDAIIYLSMHGAADQHGPYLIADDAVGLGEESDKVRLDGLFAALAELPEEQHKLLLIDVTTLRGVWRLGVPANTFASALQQYDPRIAEIPNLVVVCSSSEGEKSWVNQPEQRTSFGYHLRRALNGLAVDSNNDGRITAEEAYNTVGDRVNSWAQSHAHANQQPVLLPSGDIGTTRAQSMQLGLAQTKETQEPSVADNTWDSLITEQWHYVSQLQHELQCPESVAPQLWNSHLDRLMRLEEFAQAGNRKAVERLQGQLMVSRTQLERLASRHQLAWDPLRGTSSTSPEIAQWIDRLWTTPVQQLPAQWEKAASAPTIDTKRLRTQLYERILTAVEQSPTANLDRAARLIRLSEDPTNPRPSSIHFIAMLEKHLPASSRSADFDALLSAAISCRSKSSQLLRSSQKTGVHVSAVLPWVEPAILELDSKRRLSEDLLFGLPLNQEQVLDQFTNLNQQYDAITKRIDTAYAACETYDRAMLTLPRYIDWWSLVWHDLDDSQHDIQPTTQAIIAAWNFAHELGTVIDDLRNTPLESIDLNSTQAEEHHLASAATQLANNYQTVVMAYQQWQHSLDAKTGPVFWNNCDAALMIPTLDVESRLRLLTIRRPASAARQSTHDKRLSLTAQSEDNDAIKASTHRRMQLMAAAFDPARLAKHGYLSTESADAFSQLPANTRAGTHLDSLIQLARQLMLARTTSVRDTVSDIQNAEQLTGSTLLEWVNLNHRMQQLLVTSERPDFLVGASKTQERSRARYALLLGTRTLIGRWNGLSDTAPPYYRQATKAYLVAARGWNPHEPQLDSLERLVAQPWDFTIRTADDGSPIYITGSESLPIGIQLLVSGVESGNAQVWGDADSGLSLSAPATGTRLNVSVGENKRTSQGSVVLKRTITQPVADFLPSSNSQAELRAFFRGHLARVALDATLINTPHFRSVKLPPPRTTAVAILDGSPPVASKASNFAITFVVDASGSMGPTSDGKSFKYQQAVEALKSILQDLPSGVRVSVWVFGEAIGRNKTVDRPEQTIHRLMRPIAWDQNDTKVLDELVSLLSNIEPWNESPVADAIVAARQDLFGFNGEKMMVVLTDGEDNRLATETGITSPHELSQVLPLALDGTGIALQVLEMSNSPTSQSDSTEPFRLLDQLNPPGRWWVMDELSSLQGLLHDEALKNRLITITPKNGSVSTAKPITLKRNLPTERVQSDLLPAGQYQIEAENRMHAVSVIEGDTLLLQSYSGMNGEAFRRVSIADTDHATSATVSAKGGTATLLKRRAPSEAPTEILLSIESSDLDGKSPLSVPHCDTLWLEYYPDASSHASQPLAWTSTFGYPAQCWSCLAASDGSVTNSRSPARLKVWWINSATEPSAVQLRRGFEFSVVSQLAGTHCKAVGDTVTFSRVACELETLPTSQGTMEPQFCLNVELSHPIGSMFQVSLEGMTPQGQQHDYYPSIGRTTAKFWPVNSAQLDQLVTGVSIVAIDELKAKAEQAGSYAELTSMGTFPTGEIPPAPVIDFSSAPTQ